ncbi:hypothetical protein [Iodobacter fluviatilis]|uniref:Uncharacterized protein n=1 Tax=Iodobacter fluviatilis TaxID=537 RepID=A0A7G3GE81_9NEIS|nr:hypothetical protein [Iodobacter fluviatilis]QBC45478.1 hypothetical protein C1H71_19395 [Iodobacter fluviatilis]
MTVSFDTFIQTAWADHGDHPQDVAARLAIAMPEPQSSTQTLALARLICHVYGEHLAQWQQGIDLLNSLPATDAVAADATRLNCAILSYASGQSAVLATLSAAEQAHVFANTSSIFAAQGAIDRAIEQFIQALAIEEPLPTPVHRALAIAGNALACTLEEIKRRTAAETNAMILAAQSTLKYWQLAGTWLEVERAYYRLCRSLLQAEQINAALSSAQSCLSLCLQNKAPAFELFFAYAILAITQSKLGNGEAFTENHQAARAFFKQLPVDEQPWCDAELKELAAVEEHNAVNGHFPAPPFGFSPFLGRNES